MTRMITCSLLSRCAMTVSVSFALHRCQTKGSTAVHAPREESVIHFTLLVLYQAKHHLKAHEKILPLLLMLTCINYLDIANNFLGSTSPRRLPRPLEGEGHHHSWQPRRAAHPTPLHTAAFHAITRLTLSFYFPTRIQTIFRTVTFTVFPCGNMSQYIL